MGVNPILGLTTEPLNGLIGDCCDLSGTARVRETISSFLRLVRSSLQDYDWPRIRA